jgi:hypothetical protein
VAAVVVLAGVLVIAPSAMGGTSHSTTICAGYCQSLPVDDSVVATLAETGKSVCDGAGEQQVPPSGPPLLLVCHPDESNRTYYLLVPGQPVAEVDSFSYEGSQGCTYYQGQGFRLLGSVTVQGTTVTSCD